jgi:hypothetical protein
MLALISSALFIGTVRADDGATARAVIDEAIRAHGGEAALTKWPVVTVKTEGIFHGYERTPVYFFTDETTTHGAEQFRAVLDGELNKQKFRVVNVLDGKRGWVKPAGASEQDVRACTPAQLRELQEGCYITWVTKLVPLKGREFTLALTGEEKVLSEPALGVRVSSRGRRDVTLFFDKESRLLVKTETRATAGTGKEGKVETFLRLHKDFHGVKRPTMWMVNHDARPLFSHWVRDYEVAKEAAPAAFAQP